MNDLVLVFKEDGGFVSAIEGTYMKARKDLVALVE